MISFAIGFRFFAALFFSVMTGFCFRKAQKLEKEDPYYNDYLDFNGNGAETYIWMTPTIIVWALSAFCILFMVILGFSEGLYAFETLALEIVLLLSIYFVFLLVLMPFLRKKISARACAILWIVPLFLFYNLGWQNGEQPMPLFIINVPSEAIKVLFIAWPIGFLLIFGVTVIKHLAFIHKIEAESYEVADEKVLAIWEEIRNNINYRRDTKLIVSPYAKAPFSMGYLRKNRCTVFPEKKNSSELDCWNGYTEEELRMILSHELHHLQRCDVNTKITLAFCRALCWFNPLVWIATQKAAEDLELSCDEIVTKDMNASQRRAYANLLLEEAAPSYGFTTCLSSAAVTLRYRMKNVVEERKRLNGTIVLAIAIFACVMSFGMVDIAENVDNTSDELFPNGINSTHLYVETPTHEYYDVYEWDSDALMSELNEIEIVRISTSSRLSELDADTRIVIYLRDGGDIIISDKFIRVRQTRRPARYYVVTSAVDWDGILSTLTI